MLRCSAFQNTSFHYQIAAGFSLDTMGNCCSKNKSPEELQDLFKDIEDTGNINELIHHLLERIKAKQQNRPENASTSSQPSQENEEESGKWAPIIKRGSQFLEWLNKFVSSEKLHKGIKAVAGTLQQVGQINSTVAGLSMIAFVLSKYEKMRDNEPECLRTLGDLIVLARHLRSLKGILIQAEEEKFRKAIEFIVEGSITCLCLSQDNKLFRFMKSSVNSENLTSLRKRINELYPDILLTTIIDIRKDIATHLPITPPVYPVTAVGIDMQVTKISDILTNTRDLSLAVVVYGFGGLGKTTLADAVVSTIDTNNYYYTSLQIHQESENNDFRKSQQQILKDCFPNYNNGQLMHVRDCKDGQRHLIEAFKSHEGKPIFIFIDNALRSEDLQNLLPEDLGGLPQCSRILVTTRRLDVTDCIVERQSNNLERIPFPLHPLPDQYAKNILLKNPTKGAQLIKEEDLNRILKICSGVPLALEIVGRQLDKHNYSVESCANILHNLEMGDNIIEEQLSDRLVDFTYNYGLEEYVKEAFLDICCFFSEWNRQDVEYIVGAEAVTYLLEAGFISSNPTRDRDRDHPGWEKLIVHDIIRAKGQSKAKRTRIFDVPSLLEAANEQRLDQIKGVWLDNQTSEYVVEERLDFSIMRESLRVLCLGKGVKASRASDMIFTKLRFVDVSRCGIPGLPVKLEKVEGLRVFRGPFYSSQGEPILCKLPSTVKTMLVTLGEFDSRERIFIDSCDSNNKSSLKKLIFSGSWELPNIPNGFNQLEALEVLILDKNGGMMQLPDQICKLPSLKILSMRQCVRLLSLPESFGLLGKLECLDLSGCIRLQTLPDSFGQLTALRDLYLCWCEALESLPHSFKQLTDLRMVNQFRCPAFGANDLTGIKDFTYLIRMNDCVESYYGYPAFEDDERKGVKDLTCMNNCVESSYVKDLIRTNDCVEILNGCPAYGIDSLTAVEGTKIRTGPSTFTFLSIAIPIYIYAGAVYLSFSHSTNHCAEKTPWWKYLTCLFQTFFNS